METVLNLSAEEASNDAMSAEVVDPDNRGEVKYLLDFTAQPTRRNMLARIERLAEIARENAHPRALISGGPTVM